MNRYIYYMVIAVSLAACSKNLDQPPQDQVSNSQYWKTTQDLESYTYQFYTVFPNFRNLVNIVQNFFIGTMGSDAVYGSDHQVMSTPATQLNGTGTVSYTHLTLPTILRV